MLASGVPCHKWQSTVLHPEMRPADLLLRDWTTWCVTAVDCTDVSPQQMRRLSSNEAISEGSLLSRLDTAAMGNTKEYAEVCAHQVWLSKPFVAERCRPTQVIYAAN